MRFREAGDAFVVGDKGAAVPNRRGDQQPVRRIAVFEVRQTIRTHRRVMTEWHR